MTGLLVSIMAGAAWQPPVAGQLPPLDFGGFLMFIIAVIIWLALGSWGASILTRKNYLAPDSPRVARTSDVVHRSIWSGVSPQMGLTFLGPILLVAAAVLPKKSPKDTHA